MRGRACWLVELSCNLWSGMQCSDEMRIARAVDLVRTQFFFLPARLLFPTLLSDIFQTLNLRLFSSCLQNRQRLKKEERARCQAKCRRTSCATCPCSCPPEQLRATIAIEMGDHARIDVDSPLWDQTTFIGLPSKSAENDLGEKIQVGSGTLHGCRTLSADLTLQPPWWKQKNWWVQKRSPTQLLQIANYLKFLGGRLSRWARACWDDQGASCERHGSVQVTWRFLTIGIGSLYR